MKNPCEFAENCPYVNDEAMTGKCTSHAGQDQAAVIEACARKVSQSINDAPLDTSSKRRPRGGNLGPAAWERFRDLIK